MSRYHAASHRIGAGAFYDIRIDHFTVSGKPPGPYTVYFPSGDKGHGGPPHVHIQRGNNKPAKIVINDDDTVETKKSGDYFKNYRRELRKVEKKMQAHAKRIKREWYKWQASAH